MGEGIEGEVRLLVRQISDKATLGGGLDRQAYDASIAASTALAARDRTGAQQGREAMPQAMRVRLRGL